MAVLSQSQSWKKAGNDFRNVCPSLGLLSLLCIFCARGLGSAPPGAAGQSCSGAGIPQSHVLRGIKRPEEAAPTPKAPNTHEQAAFKGCLVPPESPRDMLDLGWGARHFWGVQGRLHGGFAPQTPCPGCREAEGSLARASTAPAAPRSPLTTTRNTGGTAKRVGENVCSQLSLPPGHPKRAAGTCCKVEGKINLYCAWSKV